MGDFGLTKEWLDGDGRFWFGKHEGELAEDVVESDPGYIKWILDECDSVCDEDHEVFTTLARRAGIA